MEYRVEHDSMGEVRVPADKYWGAQTERSHNNFPIGVGIETMPREITHAFGILKKAAAMANHSLRPEKMTNEKLTAISAALSATVFGIPMGLIVAAAAVALGVAIAAIVGSMGGSKKNVSHGGGSSGGGSSGSGGMGSVDITTGTGSLEDAINANTKALEKTNSALADMIRQAGALVLSDNMRLGSTVAASGTAQVVSAARSYHREGDTTINQYIQSKAQTAADLARETRWEADKAKARKR